MYMDASKTLNLVHHRGLMNINHDQGLTGKLWNLHNSMYVNIRSQVKWDGLLSAPFIEPQGIRQGAHLSAKMFKNRCVPVLNRASTHPDCFHIGHIKCGALMVADDLLLASQTSRGLQNLVTEAKIDASHEGTSSAKPKPGFRESTPNSQGPAYQRSPSSSTTKC